MTDHALDRLYATIAARKTAGDAPTSYTAQLLVAGVEKCAKKFGEEAVEAVIAAIDTRQDGADGGIRLMCFIT